MPLALNVLTRKLLQRPRCSFAVEPCGLRRRSQCTGRSSPALLSCEKWPPACEGRIRFRGEFNMCRKRARESGVQERVPLQRRSSGTLFCLGHSGGPRRARGAFEPFADALATSVTIVTEVPCVWPFSTARHRHIGVMSALPRPPALTELLARRHLFLAGDEGSKAMIDHRGAGLYHPTRTSRSGGAHRHPECMGQTRNESTVKGMRARSPPAAGACRR